MSDHDDRTTFSPYRLGVVIQVPPSVGGQNLEIGDRHLR